MLVPSKYEPEDVCRDRPKLDGVLSIDDMDWAFSENHNVDHPVSLYAATKKANELMAHAYIHLYGIPAAGLRLFTLYGPWGMPYMALFLCS